MKQSSIEWFINELDKTIPYQHISKSQIFTDIIEQAKAMHKEEIENAYDDGWHNNNDDQYNPINYYNKTFGGKDEQQ